MAALQPFTFRCIQAPFLRFSLWERAAILGRSSRCDFVVDDASVSRRHAELCLAESGLQIADLRSRNGTFVANLRIQTSRVNPGQIVRFGNIAFAVATLELSSEEETDDPGRAEDRVRGQWHQYAATLSDAQQRVFKLLLEGLPEKTIAKRLYLSRHTVHKHTQAVFRTFEVHSRAQLLSFIAHTHGNLVSQES
jgi:pSer/pThr/pTyr-binding forkhead associated (FHA) protein